MTNEEAIKLLSNRYMVVSECIDENNAIKENIALDMAIEALEKQIAKPKHKYSGIRCVCGEVVARYQDYCEYCGQRLLPYEVD